MQQIETTFSLFSARTSSLFRDPDGGQRSDKKPFFSSLLFHFLFSLPRPLVYGAPVLTLSRVNGMTRVLFGHRLLRMRRLQTLQPLFQEKSSLLTVRCVAEHRK